MMLSGKPLASGQEEDSSEHPFYGTWMLSGTCDDMEHHEKHPFYGTCMLSGTPDDMQCHEKTSRIKIFALKCNSQFV